jgi:hypothetical protein
LIAASYGFDVVMNFEVEDIALWSDFTLARMDRDRLIGIAK